MRTKDIHTLCQILLSNMVQGNDLLHSNLVNFISCFQSFAIFHLFFKGNIACFLSLFHNLCNTFTFCLSYI